MATTYGSVTNFPPPTTRRNVELLGLFLASCAVGCGLWLVYGAKTANPDKVDFSAVREKLKKREIVNLNTVPQANDIAPLLTVLDNAADRAWAAQKIFEYVRQHNRQVQNFGALAQLRVSREEIKGQPQLLSYNHRLNDILDEESQQNPPVQSAKPIPLFTARQLSQLKPAFIVRSPEEFQTGFWLWAAGATLAFYAAHLLWRRRGWQGDQFVLPVVHLLSGLGLISMASLRDPLRDTFSLVEFATGLLGGVVVLAVVSQFNVRRMLEDYALVPLLAALVLSALLVIFGTGPGTSDAKVNLWGLQPVEFIKILAALFLAGYFARNWDSLRELTQKNTRLTDALGLSRLPRLRLVLPVLVGTGLVLLFFFLQRDLGPALVLGATFLALYAVARNRYGLVALGLALLVGGVTVGYRLGWPTTVVKRISIWRDPLENGLRNGDQIAHGWWALANGGLTGTGLGLGDPSLIPAGHTDLILASLGEELGFIGVALTLLLYVLLLAQLLNIARRAADYYSFFLTLALALLTAWQTALITAGILGLLPLSGVVSPFLSWGKSSMLANCLIVGLALAVSQRPGTESVTASFAAPLRKLSWVLGGVACALLLKAAYLQVWQGDSNLVAPVLTKQADGAYRYLYNPRVSVAERLLTQGSIYDRNGLPLATSSWEELEQHRTEYSRLGISIEKACQKSDSRHYPLGRKLFHFLGDARTEENYKAPNTAFLERDYSGRMRGFDDKAAPVPRIVPEPDPSNKTFAQKEVQVLRRDLSELIPLVRYRYRPGQADAEALLKRPRQVTTSLDAGLQMRVATLLEQKLKAAGKKQGAVVVLDPSNGDVLASVSYPWPLDVPLDAPRPPLTAANNDDDADQAQRNAPRLLDRARYGSYPPGSTFKVVTAMAALRLNPTLADKSFDCVALGNGRVGQRIDGVGRPIQDDSKDTTPHGHVTLVPGLVVSCNAYFAQLGVKEVGAAKLFEIGQLFNMNFTQDEKFDWVDFDRSLPQAAYGQFPVVVSPFQMARVAATVAHDGQAPFGRWVTDESNLRTAAPQPILTPELNRIIADAMRQVVTSGTGKALQKAPVPVAGKTGTAELKDQDSHSWFIGYAPYAGHRQIAFATLIENGGYGGGHAADLSRQVVAAAQELGLMQ